MKRDIFSRPQRMTQRYGDLEQMSDPLISDSTFKPPIPKSLKDLHNPGFNIKDDGQYRVFSPPRSPVCKPGGGYADLNGKRPDLAEALAHPYPVSTKKRKDHLETDK